ncbi:hypothetical protein D3Y57_09830 [Sphingomonas paeninsulae]|uniref:Uncharacterized protein n=1 Tax=Sphingomonas paeninsulae TaxID=2319844 RepID=A0A494T9X3_SPHPE|nr:hypothetical protein [Sphingomonas paeninsulae]AYJ86209.1 hypothetical protein D3Y57_09830 [Sphingomonas paeninsulae]
MTDFVKYDLDTGAFRGAGSTSDDHVDQQASTGIGVVRALQDVLISNTVDGITLITVDLTPVRGFLTAKIDADAGAFRAQFITVSPGQEMTYVFKAAEAKAWVAGAPDADFPFMAAEAAAGGRTIADVQTEVAYSSALFIKLGSRIEGARMAAKAAVTAATNIKDMVAASAVDWAALAAP